MTTNIKAEALDYLANRYLEKARLYDKAYATAVSMKDNQRARKFYQVRSRYEAKLQELVSLA